jgi:hypothetical protein
MQGDKMKTFKDYLAEEEYDRQRDADAVSGKPRKTSVGGGKKPKGYSKDKAEKAAVDNVKKVLGKESIDENQVPASANVLKLVIDDIKKLNSEMDYANRAGYDEDVRMIGNRLADLHQVAELVKDGGYIAGVDTAVADDVVNYYDKAGEPLPFARESITAEGGMSDVMIGVEELISDYTNDGDKESGLKMSKDEAIQAIADAGGDPMEVRYAIDTINSEFDDNGNYKYTGYGESNIDRIKDLAGITEETYDGDDFYEAYGDLWYNEDEVVDEAEYQGRKVKLGKPMQGDVKKFKVYVKDPKTGNVKKVNFGDPNMKIKKSNPARRRSFRARHNCDNPGPRTKARYWSCRKW